ncbi:MAG: hypothetical protein M3068_09830 [Gemmatimonadota bacterium]|nr:hypothetical protein [Gemmatimonadota bacterium]
MTEGRERFLRAIAEQIPLERIEEIHLFQPNRQGGRETGVAVIAARQERPLPVTPAAHAGDAPPPADDSWLDTDAPMVGKDANELAERARARGPAPDRLTIFTAHYRLTFKGMDRGKWEVDVNAEAEAPLATVDEVVRGVVRRAGDEAAAERLTGDALRSELSG